MSRLDVLVAAHPMPRMRSVAGGVMAMIVFFLGWSYFAQLDEVAVAPGEVIPQGQVKAIQHLEGGIVEEIHVTDGRAVAKGDPLVRVQLGLNAANGAELQVQIDGLLLKRARLQAEAAGKAPTFEADMAGRMADVARAEREAFASRQRQFESGLEVLRSQTRQRALQVEELVSKLRGRQASLRLVEQRLAMSAELLKNNLVPKMTHVELQNEVQTLRTEVSELESTLPKVRAGLAEAQERERAERLNFRRAVIEELGQVELAIARNRELMARATDQVQRTLIVSPIDGVVKNLRYHTIGGVVRPGETIMEIVPSNETLVVEAKLNPADIGYVRAGQPAVVKMLTYDFVRYGGLDGKVVSVAPDSSVDRDGRAFFRVVVQTDKSYMGDRPGALPLGPGMQTQVDIHTGSKSVLEYLVSPVVRLRDEAFRER